MSENRANISRLKEIAIRGDEYREENTYPYFGEEITIFLQPLKEKQLLPLQTLLMEQLGMDLNDAENKIENAAPSDLDEDFISIMHEIALRAVDTTQGDAEGADEQELREVFGAVKKGEDDSEEIGFVGGVGLEIAQDAISISSDADSADKFRRDGGSE
jgi:hypothetical protein